MYVQDLVVALTVMIASLIFKEVTILRQRDFVLCYQYHDAQIQQLQLQRMFPALPLMPHIIYMCPLELARTQQQVPVNSCSAYATVHFDSHRVSQSHPLFPHLQASIPLHSSVPRPAAGGFALPSQPMSLMQCLMAQVIE